MAEEAEAAPSAAWGQEPVMRLEGRELGAAEPGFDSSLGPRA